MSSFGSAGEFSCVTQNKSNENYGVIGPLIEMQLNLTRSLLDRSALSGVICKDFK